MNDTSFNEDRWYAADPVIYSAVALNPAINRVANYLGPAGLHLIAHLALNLSKPVERRAFFMLSRDVPNTACQAKYLQENVRTMGEFYEENDFFNILGAPDHAFRMGDEQGWIMNILRGLPAWLYDPVSGHCFLSHSYQSGLINPLYAGVYRGDKDLSRANTFCGGFTHDSTKRLLKNLF
jgi:hypothetical protein